LILKFIGVLTSFLTNLADRFCVDKHFRLQNNPIGSIPLKQNNFKTFAEKFKAKKFHYIIYIDKIIHVLKK
jgi:hypothetical protein